MIQGVAEDTTTARDTLVEVANRVHHSLLPPPRRLAGYAGVTDEIHEMIRGLLLTSSVGEQRSLREGDCSIGLRLLAQRRAGDDAAVTRRRRLCWEVAQVCSEADPTFDVGRLAMVWRCAAIYMADDHRSSQAYLRACLEREAGELDAFIADPTVAYAITADADISPQSQCRRHKKTQRKP